MNEEEALKKEIKWVEEHAEYLDTVIPATPEDEFEIIMERIENEK